MQFLVLLRPKGCWLEVDPGHCGEALTWFNWAPYTDTMSFTPNDPTSPGLIDQQLVSLVRGRWIVSCLHCGVTPRLKSHSSSRASAGRLRPGQQCGYNPLFLTGRIYSCCCCSPPPQCPGSLGVTRHTCPDKSGYLSLCYFCVNWTFTSDLWAWTLLASSLFFL